VAVGAGLIVVLALSVGILRSVDGRAPNRYGAAQSTASSSTSPPSSTASSTTTGSTATTVPLAVGAPVAIPDLGAFEFLSADQGVALAFGDRLATTADSGRSWAIAGAALPTGSGESWTGLVFMTPEVGFVYGTDVASTTDGGGHWRLANLTTPSTPDVADVQAVGTSVWALVGCVGRGAGTAEPCRGHLAVSSDTGRTWTTLATGPTLSGDTSTLSRADARLAYVHASTYLPEPSDPGIAVTSDGGHTWAYRQDPCTAPIGETLVAHRRGDLWLFCAGEPSAGQQLKQVFRSTDQGRHWAGVVDHHSHSDPGRFPGSGYLNDVEVVSATTAWVALYRGGVWSTADGGHAWTEAPIRGSELLADQVSFTDPNHGWAREDGVLWHTTDGTHWTPLNQPSIR
jgi:photosystem II stability/assembly factor-like uncharacterized protein